MRKTIFFSLAIGTFFLLPSHSFAANTTVSTAAAIPAALGNIAAGDTVFVRAGTYSFFTTISLSVSGTSAKKCCLMVYPGDQRPVFDFSSMAVGGSNRGVTLKGNYWLVKGIIIKGAGDNGMNISGSNNIVEFCDFLENQDSGCQLGGGAANNKVINCDSYYNIDPGQGNADGFSPKLDVGTGNYFKGCRSWQNSDDGFDGYMRPSDDITTTFENCWCYKNGYLKDGSAGTGNGNGFKMGGSDNKDLRHNQVLKNCLSVGNLSKGFDQNNNKGSMTLYNCTGFNNGTNYSINGTILASGKTLTVTNCVSAGTGGVSLTGGTIATCSWSSGFSASSADFVSVDPTQMTRARKPDGSLPDITFMHLASGSRLIDAGTVIAGMAYAGAKPDLGCFETGSVTGVLVSLLDNRRQPFAILPLSSGGLFKIVSPTGRERLEDMKISLLDIAGKKVAAAGMLNAGSGSDDYVLDLRSLDVGTYICKVSNGAIAAFQTVVRK